MKRITALLLALVMALSLTACGSSAPAETEAPAAVPSAEAPTEAPTTEPTLSPEEILYNSLPDRMKQAVDVGIVELGQLENPDKEITIAEAARMLQNAYTLYHGVESKLIADVLSLDIASEPAYLGWIGRLPIAMHVEALEPEKYESYDQWIAYVIKLSQGYDLSGRITSPVGAEGYSYWDGDEIFVRHSYGWFDIGWKSGMDTYFYRNMPEGNALLDSCVGQGNLLAYTSYLYDHTSGHKVLEVSPYDEVPVEQVMTVSTMAEMALRTYHSFYQDVEVAPYEDCVTADTTILTAELLGRETTLPDASCTNLPVQWHGVTMDEAASIDSDGVREHGHYDMEIYEYEIQAIKDAGFNYIGLQIDFSWLQSGNWGSRQNPLDGQLDMARLKKVDQILAWCMERDIHLDIRCTGVGGAIWGGKQDQWSATDKNAEEFAKIWSVLARRYAEVPNTYLSFTVMDNVLQRTDWIKVPVEKLGYTQNDLVTFVKPSVEAIREATPDRCIILDLSGNNIGTDVLELGVALSADLTGILCEFFAPPEKNIRNPDWYQTVQWPYKGTVNAESLLHVDQIDWKEDSTVIRVMELAQENGLGFMFGGWGKQCSQYKGSYYCAARYPDETYRAFITDMTDTMESYGYGWCYEEWYGHNGITFSAPITRNVVYEQIGDYPMYYDTAMLSFFKEVNGVQ